MPLPPTLAKKLAKRGILTPKVEITKNSSFKGYDGCPNKYNIYHDCTKYCMIKWKVGILEPPPKCLKQREMILKKYPLPPNWKEIYDRGCGRFYYWDIKNDVVSWLSPKHPSAKISASAAYLREERILQADEQLDKAEDKKKHSPEEKDAKKHNNHRYKPFSKTNYPSDSHLDPMDPAAYSDIPKGPWSAGLHTKPESERKTTTTPVIGPIYQIRSYHSPTIVHKKK